MLANRMARELKMLAADPPPGVAAWPVGDSSTQLRAQIRGPHATVYERGVFTLSITIPPRYPLEPPALTFKTLIHHPNIDAAGRICLDTLGLPPKGAWRPALNLGVVLASVRALLASPNADDGLDPEVTHQYRHDRAGFEAAARAMTARYACGGGGEGGGEGGLSRGECGVGPASGSGGGGGGGGVAGLPGPEGAENRAPPPPPQARGGDSAKARPVPSPPRPASRLQLGGGGANKRPREEDQQ